MRSIGGLKRIWSIIGPAGLGNASAFLRLPEWFLGTSATKEAAKAAAKAGPPPTLGDFQPAASSPGVPRPKMAEGSAVQSLVDEMLLQSRYALLLRPQLVGNLTVEQLARTRAAFSEGMCLVPEGEVALRRDDVRGELTVQGGPLRDILHVEAFYLDRYPVTNAQYQRFVSSGGYEQMAIWDREIWPAVLDFVDRTGHPGPRFWQNGTFAKGEESYPVVGVNWYEATAYARWAGKRLVTDAEWIKAASWPVSFVDHGLLQRRFPWGEAMDRSRANLWGSGPGRAVSVEDFSSGVSVGGVQQLIGNVWEWTADRFALDDEANAQPCEKTNLKSLRGGAFDTYLDNQATCHFQSADWAMARKHNIGFRLAINLCDLTKDDACHVPGLQEEDEEALAEEVT